MAPDTPKREAVTSLGQSRGKWRYGLRGLLIAITVAGCLLGWESRRVLTQRRAVSVLQHEGISYYYQFDNTAPGEDRAPWYVPNFLRAGLGPDLFQAVRSVGRATDPPMSAEALGAILCLPKVDYLEAHFEGKMPENWRGIETLHALRTLDLVANELTDEDLVHLGGLQCLENVGFRGTQLTDVCVSTLQRIPSLRFVLIEDGAISDAGAAEILRLPNLQLLTLIRVPVTDETLRNCRHHPRLMRLVIEATGLSDAGVSHLATLPNLTDLVLAGSNLTDESLRVLGAMTKLTDLSLRATSITDQGLDHLDALMGLRDLDVEDTAVTRAGAQRFMQKHPACRVRY